MNLKLEVKDLRKTFKLSAKQRKNMHIKDKYKVALKNIF